MLILEFVVEAFLQRAELEDVNPGVCLIVPVCASVFPSSSAIERSALSLKRLVRASGQ